MLLSLLITLLVITAVIGILPRVKTASDFWLNDRRTPLWLLVFTIVSTQIGGGTVLGIAGSTAKEGLGFGVVALVSTVTGFLAVAFLAPRIARLAEGRDIYTLPEFLGTYLGDRLRLVASLIVIVAYLSLLAGQVVAASEFVKLVFGGDVFLTLLISGAGVVVYGAVAGFRGDLIADTFLFGVMIVALCITGFYIIAGTPIDYSLVPPDTYSLTKFGGYTYLVFGLFFGAVIPVVSMEMWLRIFASAGIKTAQRSFLFSSILVIPFYILAIFVGIHSVALGISAPNSDSTMIEFTRTVMATPFREFVLVSLVAVIASTANTLLIVVSSTISRDLMPPVSIPSIFRDRIVVAVTGVVATGLAMFFSDIVALVLNAFFLVTVLLPSILVVLFKLPFREPILRIGTWFGFVITLVAIPFLGNQAFLPGFCVSSATLIVSWLAARPASNDA